MIKVLFSHRIRIQDLFESWCIKNGASGSYNNLIAFMEQNGWLNSDKIVEDLKRMKAD